MDLTQGSLYLVLYIVVWLIVLIRHQKRNNNQWGAGSILIISYVIFGVCSFFLYGKNPGSYGDLELFPLFYLFVTMLIASMPVLQYDNIPDKVIEAPNLKLLNYFSGFFIVISLIQLPRIFSNLVNGITMIMIDSSAGLELYNDSLGAGGSDGVIRNILAIFYNLFSPLAILLFFYYLTLENKKIVYIIGYAFTIIVTLLEQLSRGMRTSTTLTIYTIIITYFALKQFYSRKVNKLMICIIVFALLLISIPFIALTKSRFDGISSETSRSLLAYSGMSVINFDKYGLDAGGIRYGDRTCTIFKKMIGLESPNDFWECRAKYSNMKMDDSVFYTFIGDFTLDFGPITAFIIICLFSFLFCKWTKPINDSIIPFHTLIIYYFAMTVCIQGAMYLYSYSFNGNLIVIAFFMVYLIFYHSRKSLN